MRFIVGHVAGIQSVFVVNCDQTHDLTAVLPGGGQDLSALTASDELQAKAQALQDLDASIRVADITPALPNERPTTIIFLGPNYVENTKEGGYDIPDGPALFVRNANSVLAAGAPLVRPGRSGKLGYEAELMVIIVKGGRHISEADALDHVFGHTVFNDGRVRDYQCETHQWTPGKNFDNTGAIGPFVVTPTRCQRVPRV